jgi:hypothetical protein
VAIQLSLVLLFGVVLVVMIRGGSIKPGPAIVAVLFGFSLATTGAAEPIASFLQSITDSIGSVDNSINQSGR